MKLEKVDHLHFAVNDIPKFQKAFSRLLGLKFTPIQEFPLFKAFASNSIGPVDFTLVKPTSPENYLNKFLREKGEGLSSFCLKISDYDHVIADFDARGIKYNILPERSRFGKGVRILQIDPSEAYGVRIEFIEYSD